MEKYARIQTFNSYNRNDTVPISAESIEEAIDILLKKQSDLERHPMGKLNLEIDKIIVIPVEPKTFN